MTRAVAAGLMAALLAAVAPAEETLAPATPADGLSAEQIYERVLENRFDSSIQELLVQSRDRAGNQQPTRMQLLWRRYPEGSEDRADGILSRTVVRYLDPADVRRTGYLVVNREGAPNDQFVYLHSLRRVRRINMRTETLAGTDLAVEDVVPRELDDASYARVPDETVDGVPCFAIDAIPTGEADSHYSKLRLYVEKERYVALRTRYWDHAGVEIKELRSPHEAIREFDGIYLPVRATMRSLVDGGSTELRVAGLVPNPQLPDRYFSVRQIESRKLAIPRQYLENLRENP